MRYWDTSTLAKLYVAESDSAQFSAHLSQTGVICLHGLEHAEMRRSDWLDAFSVAVSQTAFILAAALEKQSGGALQRRRYSGIDGRREAPPIPY